MDSTTAATTERLDHQLHAYAGRPLAERLRRFAFDQRRSKSSIIVTAVDDYLRRRGY